MTLSPSDFSRQLDPVTGVVTVRGWVNALPDGMLLLDGHLLALHLVGLLGLQQRYGHAVGEALLREIVTRVQQRLPQHGLLMQGEGNVLYLWLPGQTSTGAEELVFQLRKAISAVPITLPETGPISPKLAQALVTVPPNTRAMDAIQQVSRELVRQPEFMAPPASVARAVSVQDELNSRLLAVGLYGREPLIEQILASLQIPAMLPQTIFLAGPPQAGKMRLLNSVGKLLGGQRLPLAEVTCLPSEQLVPCSLLATLIYQFLTAYPREILPQRFGVLCQANPWLAGLFSGLGDQDSAPPPPTDPRDLRQGLEPMLVEMARMIPHVAIVHGFPQADALSLDVLAALQAAPGHGLRVIAGVEVEEASLPLDIAQRFQTNTTLVRIAPFSPALVLAYLQEILPDIAREDVVTALYEESKGLPLAIECTLRAWADDGVLDYREGKWGYYPERKGSAPSANLTEEERRRLAYPAVSGSLTTKMLATLWNAPLEEVRETVERGRALGYLRPINFNTPDLVACADEDQAQTLLHSLTRQDLVAVHAAIGTLLEQVGAAAARPPAQAMAYHFTQAGLADQAQRYQQQARQTPLTPILVSPQASVIGGIDDWNIPPAAPIEPDALQPIIDAALAVRLTGIQFRLYPPTSDLVRSAVNVALAALEKLFTSRPSFIISYDGRTVAFDGQIIQRRDLQVAVKDYQSWMIEGNLRAIGITRNVRDFELGRFLHALVSFDGHDNQASVLNKIMLLNLTNIKVLTRSFQPDLPQASLADMGHAFGQSEAMLPAPSSHALATPGDDRPGAYRALPPVIPSAALSPEVMPRNLDGAETVPTLADPRTLAPETWRQLPQVLAATSSRARRVMMANLAIWLSHEKAPDAELGEQIDLLLRDRVGEEADRQTFQEIVSATEQRLDRLLRQQDWNGIETLLLPCRARLLQHPPPEIANQLTLLLSRIGESTALRGIISGNVEQGAAFDGMRRVVGTLGEYTLRPLITALKDTTVMQGRIRILQLLREIGTLQQPVLIRELRTENPWYVYRNLLQVLGEVGNEEALATISEKMSHPDYRVRAEAVYAATRIARDKAAVYLVAGLQDPNVSVRSRAITLVSHCPQPRVLEILRQMLHARLGKEEPDAIQLSACLGLGYFKEDAAREILLRIVHASILSPYRHKSDEIRNAAVTALAHHLPHPQTEAALKKASTDRSLLVRQTAQRILQQHAAG